MIRVLHLGPDRRAAGGVATVIAQLAKQQADDPEIEVVCIPTMRPVGPLGRGAIFGLAAMRLSLMLAGGSKTILHVHVASGWSFRRKACLMRIGAWLGAPSLVHVHGGAFDTWYRSNPPARQSWVSAQLNRAKCVVGLSDCWREFLRGITSAPIETVPNGVDVETLAPVCGSEGQGIKVLRLLFLGRLGERKGTFDILRAFRSVSSGALTRPLELILAGNGETDKAQNYVAEHGLEGKVRITGWVGPQEAHRLLREADIYLLPSYVEGMPMSLLEAMAAGLPVITTPVGGIPEVIGDNENGLLVPPGDVDALRLAISRLIQDAELRKRLGARARASVCERFDIRLVARRFKRIYERILSASGS